MFYFGTKSLKSSVYFTLTTHLNLDVPPFKDAISTCGCLPCICQHSWNPVWVTTLLYFSVFCPMFSSSVPSSLPSSSSLLSGHFLFIWVKSQSFWEKEIKIYFVKATRVPRLIGGSKVSQFWKKSSLFSYVLKQQCYCW